MPPLTRLGRFAVLAISALTLTGCAAPMRVNSYFERGIDVARYHTYDWDQTGPQATGDPRLDNNPFFEERVRADTEKQLAVRGYAKTVSGTPEMLIHIHASINQRIDVQNADSRYGSCVECEPYVYDAGTLLLDFIDAGTNKLLWRGWAAGSLDGVIDNQEWMEQKVDEAVTRILERLPRRLQGTR